MPKSHFSFPLFWIFQLAGPTCHLTRFKRLSILSPQIYVQVGVVKIYVAAVEALRKKERQDEIQFTTKIDGFHPRFNVHVLFCRFFFNLTLCMTKLRVQVLCCRTLQITLLSGKDFEFVSISRHGDLELVFLFRQLTNIITNVMLHMICCFLATINHICITKFHRFPSYKLLWDTQLCACNSLFFHKLYLNSS